MKLIVSISVFMLLILYLSWRSLFPSQEGVFYTNLPGFTPLETAILATPSPTPSPTAKPSPKPVLPRLTPSPTPTPSVSYTPFPVSPPLPSFTPKPSPSPTPQIQYIYVNQPTPTPQIIYLTPTPSPLGSVETPTPTPTPQVVITVPEFISSDSIYPIKANVSERSTEIKSITIELYDQNHVLLDPTSRKFYLGIDGKILTPGPVSVFSDVLFVSNPQTIPVERFFAENRFLYGSNCGDPCVSIFPFLKIISADGATIIYK